MSIATALRMTRWGASGSHAVKRWEPTRAGPPAGKIAPGTTRERFGAVLAAHAWHWARRQVERLTTPREPQTLQELLAYARSIEHAMPNQAAELRFLVMRQSDAAD